MTWNCESNKPFCSKLLLYHEDLVTATRMKLGHLLHVLIPFHASSTFVFILVVPVWFLVAEQNPMSKKHWERKEFTSAYQLQIIFEDTQEKSLPQRQGRNAAYWISLFYGLHSWLSYTDQANLFRDDTHLHTVVYTPTTSIST